MRTTARFVLAALLASAAAAGEPELVTESRDEFEAELRAAEQPEATTLQTIARRRALAAARRVHREGVVLDVKPAEREGRATVCVEVRAIGDSDTSVSLVPEAADPAKLLEWNRGDGVGWIERPRVGDDGDVSFEPLVGAVADVVRVADPARAADSAASPFFASLRLLTDACRLREWHRAFLVYRMAFEGRTWALPAHVVAADAKSVTVTLDAPVPAWPDWTAVAVRAQIGTAGAGGAVTCRIAVPPKSGPLPAAGEPLEVELGASDWGSMREMTAADGALVFTASLKSADPAALRPAALKNPAGKPADFSTWLEKFAAASYSNDAEAARTLWAEGARKSWVFPAVVKSVDGGRIEGRFCRDAFFRGTTTRRVTDLVGNPWSKPVEKPAGLWGFDPKQNHVFTVNDPDLATQLRVNRFVDVVVDLDPEGAVKAMAGPFPATITVWKLTGARPPAGK